MRDEHIVTATRRRLHRQVGRTVQQAGHLGVNAVDRVHLTGLQCGGPGCGIVQHQNFDFVRKAAVFRIPEIVAALERVTDARFVNFQRVSTCADRRRGVVHAAVGLNDQVIVGHQIGQVGVGRFQIDDEIVAVHFHVGNALHDAKGTRFAFLVRMALHGFQHVLGCHVLAVRKGDTLADLEHPLFRICRSFDTFGHAEINLAIRVDIQQGFTPGIKVVQRNFGRGQRGVLRVGGFATGRADLDRAAPFGRLVCGGLCVARQHGVGGNSRHTQGRSAADEFAACHAALGHFAGHMLQLFVHH